MCSPSAVGNSSPRLPRATPATLTAAPLPGEVAAWDSSPTGFSVRSFVRLPFAPEHRFHPCSGTCATGGLVAGYVAIPVGYRGDGFR